MFSLVQLWCRSLNSVKYENCASYETATLVSRWGNWGALVSQLDSSKSSVNCEIDVRCYYLNSVSYASCENCVIDADQASAQMSCQLTAASI